jgi:hypothetical protein
LNAIAMVSAMMANSATFWGVARARITMANSALTMVGANRAFATMILVLASAQIVKVQVTGAARTSIAS